MGKVSGEFIAQATRSLHAAEVDEEVSVLDGMGRSDFIRLQHRARRKRWYEGADPVTYCVFDLLAELGASLMAIRSTGAIM